MWRPWNRFPARLLVGILLGMFLCPYQGVSQGHTYLDFDKVKVEKSILFTKDHGLPSNSIRDITQTPDGFLWIATSNGLSRFDGTQFKNYIADDQDTASIYDNRTNCLLFADTSLWVGTFVGVSVFNLQTETFTNYSFKDYRVQDTLSKKIPVRVEQFAQGKDGSIWFGTYTEGIFRYIPQQDTFLNYHYPQEKVAPHYSFKEDIDRILSLAQDRFVDSILWVGTKSGLLRINSLTHQMTWYLYPKTDEKSFVPQNAILSIYQHDNGLLYLGSWHAQVNVFDPKKEIFYPLPLTNNSPEAQQEGFELLNSPIKTIIRKNKEELWISSLAGLMTYNTQTASWSRIQRNELKKNKIYDIYFIDNQQRAWDIAFDGLSVYDPVQQQFIQHDYDELNPDFFGFAFYFYASSSAETLTVLPRAADGIYTLNRTSNTWEKFVVPKKYRQVNGEFGPRGYSIAPNGHWTIPSLSGIYDFDPIAKTFRPLPLPSHLAQKPFRSVVWDQRGRLWIGTDSEGLIRWTPQQNRWEVFRAELEVGDPNVLAGNIFDLWEDSQQNIWIQRNGGLSVYDSNQDTFYNFLHSLQPENTVDYIHNFTEDLQGRVWVNGRNAILGYGDSRQPEKGLIQKYDLQASFNIPYLRFLRVDPQGMLWGVEGELIHRIDPNSFEITSYSLKYGVTDFDDIFGFEILPDGKMVIGGRNKFWMGDPQSFLSNPEKPTPYLSGIKVLQEPLETETPVHLLKKLALQPKENFFSLDFSSIGFTRGEDNQFKYRLKNFDDKWSDPDQRRFANFTNVPPGEYVFELQVANNEGLWNEEIFSLPIYIATPWWKAPWFWPLMVLVLLGLAYSVYKWRIGQVRKEERLRSEYERKLAHMEMSALRAQMNPHFIFNSLNSIEYFIIQNEQEKASDYLNRFSRLIRLILQNSKNTVVPLKDDLEALKLYIEIESMRFDNLFDYEVRVEEGLELEKVLVPPMLIQPYVENSIWHGLMQKKDEQGKIDLTLRKNNGTLICLIEDNGIGREAALQLKSKSGTRKKSYGMKITSDRLDALNQLASSKASVKIFDLTNPQGEPSGTRVELVIPL